MTGRIGDSSTIIYHTVQWWIVKDWRRTGDLCELLYNSPFIKNLYSEWT